ncbi:MAG: thiamine diphosphokinase [Clostridium sp.]|nr:thiamine diphosphokinase [Clostridium sp.]
MHVTMGSIRKNAKDGVCFIIGAGEIENPGWFRRQVRPKEKDYLIAADGGYTICERCGIRVDALIGDFDSLGCIPEHPNVIRLPQEKDDTDLHYAVKKGLERGYRMFEIYGATGGREGHTMANYQTLVYLAHQHACGILRSMNVQVTAIDSDTLRLPAYKGGLVSLFCMGECAEGVTLKGLKYPLSEARLTNDTPIGVSNEFIGETAEITVADGTLLVMWETGGGKSAR